MANALVRKSANEFIPAPKLYGGSLPTLVPELTIQGVNR